MNTTPVVCHLDDLGGIIIPEQFRRLLELNDWDPLDIIIDGESIILEKANLPCIFCSTDKAPFQLYDKSICPSCADALQQAGR